MAAKDVLKAAKRDQAPLKDVLISVRVTEQEKRQLEGLAKQHELSLSLLIRSLLKDFLGQIG
jgi:hypothetical protein